MTDPKAPPGMTGIVAFVEARCDANEKLAREAMGYGHSSGLRLLAYVSMARAQLALHYPDDDHPDIADCHECSHPYPCQTVRLLAAIDGDDPKYRDEWKPQAEAPAAGEVYYSNLYRGPGSDAF